MKILHLNQFGSHVGGVEGYIEDVSDALLSLGHTSHLVYFSGEATGDLLPSTTRIPLAEWPRWSSDSADALDRILVRWHPDVAYVHSVYHPSVVARIASQVPTVAYVHAPYLVCPGSAKYLRRACRTCFHKAGPICLLNAQLEKCCWGRNPVEHLRLLKRVRALVSATREVARILVASGYMRDLLLSAGCSPEQVAVLPPVLVREPAPLFTFNEGARTVLFAGRLVPEKGLCQLIEALATLETEWQLDVAGDGEDRAPSESLANRLGVADRVRFLGWLCRSDMEAAFEAAACVAVPSLWPEPFGRVGPEAFLRGRPVVAYATGGIPDWLENGVSGYLVPPGDVNLLAAGLESVLASPSRRREMGMCARQRAVSSWGAASHVHALLGAYQSATPAFAARSSLTRLIQ